LCIIVPPARRIKTHSSLKGTNMVASPPRRPATDVQVRPRPRPYSSQHVTGVLELLRVLSSRAAPSCAGGSRRRRSRSHSGGVACVTLDCSDRRNRLMRSPARSFPADVLCLKLDHRMLLRPTRLWHERHQRHRRDKPCRGPARIFAVGWIDVRLPTSPVRHCIHSWALCHTSPFT